MTRTAAALLALASTGPALAQTPAAPPKPDAPAAAPTLPLTPPKLESKTKYTVEPIAQGLEVPWAFAFLPDGKRVLVTERPGRVRMIDDGKLNPTPVFTVPDVAPLAERGLMGLCLHPDFATNNFLYLSFATKEDIRVVRYTFKPAPAATGGPSNDPGGLVDPLVVLKGLPTRSSNANHAGCRIKFGPDKKLYITAGENFKKQFAPDLKNLGGKILRLNDDGTIPADNPFAADKDKPDANRPEIWTFGNRNPQGIDWDPKSGLLWETEHGPSGEAGINPGMGGDEVNIIEKGHDYGWPTIHHGMHHDGMETPLIEWTPAIAPASANFYTGAMFPEWKGNLLVGALGGLAGQKRPGVVRLVVEGRTITGIEWLATDYGRVREVMQAPDGSIWFSTSNRDGRAEPKKDDDHIYRIIPAKPE